MKIKAKDGIFKKVANFVHKQCPACGAMFHSDIGHECDKRIEDAAWYKKVLEDPFDPTNRMIFEKRMPNPT